MRTLSVTKKTGYRIRDVNTPVIIRDWRGVLFYSTEELLPRAKEFNLPALDCPTKYIVESGMFTEREQPVNYNLIPLPDVERVFSDPSKFKILFDVNKNKCTVSWHDEVIIFDNSFKDKPLPELYFVLYHEYAHRYFKTERYVDLLATNYMLIKGFNPAQIGRAHVLSLSDRQNARKLYNIEKIIASNGQRR